MATPVRTALSGQTDASGAGSVQVKAPPTMFAVLTLAAECAGNPNWKVTAFGQPIAYGNGPQVSLGPILTSPGEVLTIAVTGGSPSSPLLGTLAGTQHATAEEAAAAYKPTANAVTINTFQKPTIVGSVQALAGGTKTSTFNITPGTVAIGILATVDPVIINNLAGSVTVLGHTSGHTYKKVYFPQAFGRVYTALWIDLEDAQADVTVDNTGGANPSDTYQLVCYPFVPGDIGPVVENGTPPYAGTSKAPPIEGQPNAWDWQTTGLFDGNAGGVTVSLTVALPANLRALLDDFSCTIVSAAAVAYVGTLSFADAGGTFWQEAITIPAVANSKDVARGGPGMRPKGGAVGPGNLTISLNNQIFANTFVRLNAGGYYIP